MASDYQLFFYSVFRALYSGINGGDEDKEDDHIEDTKDRKAAVFWIWLWACPNNINIFVRSLLIEVAKKFKKRLMRQSKNAFYISCKNGFNCQVQEYHG